LQQDGDPEGWWEESFNGHADSKPAGPEAISIDVTFPGAQHVYGIPERATNLALKPTAGVCIFGVGQTTRVAAAAAVVTDAAASCRIAE
jgi:hypothetical protein